MKDYERSVAVKLVEHCLSFPGTTLSVMDGEEWCVVRSRNNEEILDALGSTDNDEIVWRDINGTKIGWFWLIYGNGPGELIADHTDNAVCNAAYEASSNG